MFAELSHEQISRVIDVIRKSLKNKFMSTNLDRKTVESFGDEWLRFDQLGMPENEAHKRV